MTRRAPTYRERQAKRDRARNRLAHIALAFFHLPTAAFLGWAIAHCIANPPVGMPPQQFVCSLGMLATMGLAALVLGAASAWEARA